MVRRGELHGRPPSRRTPTPTCAPDPRQALLFFRVTHEEQTHDLFLIRYMTAARRETHQPLASCTWAQRPFARLKTSCMYNVARWPNGRRIGSTVASAQPWYDVLSVDSIVHRVPLTPGLRHFLASAAKTRPTAPRRQRPRHRAASPAPPPCLGRAAALPCALRCPSRRQECQKQSVPLSIFYINHDVYTNRSTLAVWAEYDAYTSESTQPAPPARPKKRAKRARTV